MSLFATKSLDLILQDAEKSNALKRSLGAGQLVALGIGAVIGAGIFSLTGIAAANNAGPAIAYSFVLAALGCAFAGFCYSEFSTTIPIAGSAYTYAYASLGEIIAWIIGWALVLEYAVGAATVSVSWTATVDSILQSFSIHLPPSLIHSPFDPMPGIMNLPAMGIVMVISGILIVGTRESARFNAVIVIVKVSVVIIFIAVGYFFINYNNYHPFLPPNTGAYGSFGWSGVFRGAGRIFFAYIGFDAVSTAAQETKNPKRDMPIGILGSLAICTVLYILYGFVLTGLVNYKDLGVAAPLALAVDHIKGYPWMGFALKLGSLLGLTSVILVMLLGQSRVFFSMSNDGLLPKLFSDVHPTFRTPWKSNILLMIFTGIPAAFMPITQLGDLTNIGTLFAFVLVCVGIIIMRRTHPNVPRPFRVPWVPIFPAVGVLVNIALMISLTWFTKIAFLVWMAVGLAVYFSYSRRHSVAQAAIK